MGCFNLSCQIANEEIKSGEDVIFICLTRVNDRSNINIYTWDTYAPIPIIFEGEMSGGSIENIKLFHNNSNKEQKIHQEFLNLFKEHISLKSASSLDEIFNETRLSLEKQRDPSIPLKLILQMYNMVPEFGNDGLKTYGFNNIDELNLKIKETENQIKTENIPIKLAIFKKSTFMKVVDNFGVKKTDSDIYSSHLQKIKKKGLYADTTFFEARDVLQGKMDYAGKNTPALTFSNLIKESKMKGDFTDIINKQILDLSILNDYFSVLGKSWTPSLYMNEEISYFGHKEAMELQADIIRGYTEIKTKKTIKK